MTDTETLVRMLAQQDREAPVAWSAEIPIELAAWKKYRNSANDRDPRPVTVEKVKFWKMLGDLAARGGKAPKLARGRVMVVFRFPNRAMTKEVSNLQPTVKAIVDGLVARGVFPDDSDDIVFGQDARRDPSLGPLRVLVIVFGEPPVLT